MSEIALPRRGSRRIFLPFAVLVTLAAAWSGFWLIMARAAETNLAAWIEHEAQSGRVYTCGSRTVGGYPFRIEVRCGDPSVTLRGETPLTITGRNLLAVWQVYRPDHVIAEITGPVSIEQPGAPRLTAEWTLGEASIRGLSARPERVSIVVDGLRVERAEAAVPVTLATADHAELHVRRDPAATAADPAVDLAVTIAGGSVPAIGGPATGPIAAQANAVLHGIGDFRPKPVAVRLKEWQAAGGRLEVTDMRINLATGAATAQGSVGLTSDGRLDGTIQVTLAGLDQVVSAISGQNRGNQAAMLAGLGFAFLGKSTELDGKPAVTAPIRFKNGTAYFGSLKLGRIAPLW